MTFPSPWTTTALWLAASRAVILVIGLVGAALFLNQRTLEVAGPAALNPAAVWQKWDAVWYERVAREGYAAAPDDPAPPCATASLPPAN